MQKQVFTGLIYTEFYTPCQHFRNLVSSWEVGKTTCVKQVVKNGNFSIFRTKLGAFRTNIMKKIVDFSRADCKNWKIS